MASEETYKNQIQLYNTWDKLDVLWQAIDAGNTPEWANGKALEYFILRAFELDGAEVRYPYSVEINSLEQEESQNTLEQIDGVIYSENIACIVECKDTEDRIAFEPIAKLRSQLMRRPSSAIASFFSTAGFTSPALILLSFIHPQTILAWEKDDIEESLKTRSFCNSLKQKYHKAIEEADYDFRIKED